MTTTKPIYEATVCGKRLRFFRSPLGDKRPDFPWHSVDDLQHCLGMSREEREFFLPAMREFEGDNPIRTIATPDGPVTIAPHFVAQALIEARQHFAEAPPGAYEEYCFQSVKATNELTGDLSGSAQFDWVIAAHHHWNGQ